MYLYFVVRLLLGRVAVSDISSIMEQSVANDGNRVTPQPTQVACHSFTFTNIANMVLIVIIHFTPVLDF